ncbi:MAG TPA: aminotransferase class IV [Candidatus Omnitrophota bacterium]|nr:aminotransferase class IV [Candidatus Omnitrophota bacterium]
MKFKVYAEGKEASSSISFDLLQDEAIGIFESMRAYHGKILHEKEHLQRLCESAKTVGYQPVPDPEKLRHEVQLSLKLSGEKNTSVRLTLLGGRVFVIIGSRGCPKELYQKGVLLKTASFPRGNGNAFPYQTKASAYQQAVLASTEPHPPDIFDWIFLDQGNYLTETRVGNFFLVTYTSRKPGLKATLWTPPEHLILNGVTRKFVIKCALELGFQVREVPLTRHDFYNADEAFLSNTSWEILPVRELDGRKIGIETPGLVTARLHRYFKRRIQQNVAPNHSSSTHQRFR